MDEVRSPSDPPDSTESPVGAAPGGQSPRAAARAASRVEEREFTERLARLTPVPYATYAFVGLNALIFIANVLSGISPMEPEVEPMIAWGAGWGPLTAHGEPWRLLTATFLHFGVIHIGLNMWVLWDAGKITERLYGNGPFAVLYLLAGLGGSAASLAWHPEVVSAGASGAVFGVYGGLLAFVRGGGGHLPAGTLARLKKSGTAFVIYNVAFGFLASGIDNAAHLGGLAVGFVVGRMLIRPLDASPAAQVSRVGRMLQAAVAVLILSVGAIQVGSRVGDAAGYDAWEAGSAALEAQDWAEARDQFTIAIETLPDEPAGYYNRALALEGLGDRPAALADMRRYVEAVPDDPDGLQHIAAWEAEPPTGAPPPESSEGE